MDEPKEKKPVNWKRVVLITVCVILALILIAVASVAIYINYLLNKINYVPKEDSRLTPSEVIELLNTDPDLQPVDPSSTESLPDVSQMTFPTEETGPIKQHEDTINILLIGQDRRGEARARSDSMILVTFNKSRGTITLTSFMRDSYVQIPGYKPNKLNHAYQYGGMSLLNETLKVNFGVEVDGDIEVDFSRFKDLIDLLGGVDISLTQKEVDYLSVGGGSKWGLKVGMNHLNGTQALAYSRIRYIDSDYRRAERQRKVLLSLVDAYKNRPLTEMIGLLDDILPLVTTNIEKGDILDLVTDLFPLLKSSQFKNLRIPADGTFRQGNVLVRPGLKNWFQYDIDFGANRKILEDAIGI